MRQARGRWANPPLQATLLAANCSPIFFMLCFNAGFSWKSWWISSKECQRPSLPPCGRIRIYSGENTLSLLATELHEALWVSFYASTQTLLGWKVEGLHLTHRVRPHAGCGSFGCTWLYHGDSGSHDSGHLGLARTVLREIHHSAVDTQTVKSYGWQDGSMGEVACQQAWRPEFDPQDLHGRRREPNLTGWPLTSTQVLSHIRPCTNIIPQ